MTEDKNMTTLLNNLNALLIALITCLSVGITSCSSTDHTREIEDQNMTASNNHCRFDDIKFEKNFPNARLNTCSKLDDKHYLFTITPESSPINDSPWYAFKINSAKKQEIDITLQFINGTPRYPPKRSDDKTDWQAIPYARSENSIHFSLSLEKEIIWLAGQEIISGETYKDWETSISPNEYVEIETIGYSVNKQPITALTLNKENKDIVIIIGRQHPPEVTGALALFSFVDALLSDSAIATQFRQRFQTVIIPNANPDGVTLGHWRHNANGVDTNRDWGLFTQPETIAIKRYIDSLSQEHTFYLGLDFHSTGKNYFYTQKDTDELCPNAFTSNWIRHISKKRPDFEFKRSGRTSHSNPTFKQWFNTGYSVPSISYEVGDNTDRPTIMDIATIAAEEMMKELLDSQCPTGN